jgi:hypothetical protein
MRPKTITVTVYPASDFGERIKFIPKAKFQMTFNLFSEHPIVMKLRALSGIQVQHEIVKRKIMEVYRQSITVYWRSWLRRCF